VVLRRKESNQAFPAGATHFVPTGKVVQRTFSSERHTPSRIRASKMQRNWYSKFSSLAGSSSGRNFPFFIHRSSTNARCSPKMNFT
jgi:hypothetical protein